MIRGETDHYDYVCAEAAGGIARVPLDTGVPCAFGVLTVDTMEQALARAGGGKRHQGEDAARAVLRMVGCAASCPVAAARMAAVNLYSDTQTRPDRRRCARRSPRPRWATSSAAEDPTTLRLQERVAELLGHEAALFMPSGTMCNQIAFRLHARPGGDELILDRTRTRSSPRPGGPAGNAQADDPRARRRRAASSRAEQLRGRASAPDDRYLPRSRLVSVEQTTNMGGGRGVAARDRPRGARGGARARPARAHGRRAADERRGRHRASPRAEYAGGFDTAWIDFTKGLGAPVGAVLAGSRELIDEAWRWKQMMGGAFRQSGIVAAGCLYALDHHVERLAEDHENARVAGRRARRARAATSIAPETNIVIFEAPDGFVRARWPSAGWS